MRANPLLCANFVPWNLSEGVRLIGVLGHCPVKSEPQQLKAISEKQSFELCNQFRAPLSRQAIKIMLSPLYRGQFRDGR